MMLPVARAQHYSSNAKAISNADSFGDEEFCNGSFKITYNLTYFPIG
jgi:hypothetical protein